RLRHVGAANDRRRIEEAADLGAQRPALPEVEAHSGPRFPDGFDGAGVLVVAGGAGPGSRRAAEIDGLVLEACPARAGEQVGLEVDGELGGQAQLAVDGREPRHGEQGAAQLIAAFHLVAGVVLPGAGIRARRQAAADLAGEARQRGPVGKQVHAEVEPLVGVVADGQKPAVLVDQGSVQRGGEGDANLPAPGQLVQLALHRAGRAGGSGPRVLGAGRKRRDGRRGKQQEDPARLVHAWLLPRQGRTLTTACSGRNNRAESDGEGDLDIDVRDSTSRFEARQSKIDVESRCRHLDFSTSTLDLERRYGRGMASVRAAAVAGSFYPADPTELRATISRLLASAEPQKPAKAIVAPHAGY